MSITGIFILNSKNVNEKNMLIYFRKIAVESVGRDATR